jgi:U3 small nucleolar RNA-associated protein 14
MSYPYSFDTQDEYLESLNTPMSEEDAEKMILREQYDEEMFECRANGIETMSFSNWLKRKILLAELFS